MPLTTPETAEQRLDRLRAMASGDDKVWNQSPTDLAALAWAVARIEHLEQLERKVAHRCTDGLCSTCDRPIVDGPECECP